MSRFTNVSHTFCARSYCFRDIKIKKMWPSKCRSRSHSTIFALTPFHGKGQNLQILFRSFLRWRVSETFAFEKIVGGPRELRYGGSRKLNYYYHGNNIYSRYIHFDHKNDGIVRHRKREKRLKRERDNLRTVQEINKMKIRITKGSNY